MKIAVSLFLTSPKSVTGAFVYIQQILPALFKLDEKNTYYLIGEAESIEYFRSLYKHLSFVQFHVVGIKRDILLNPWRAIKKLWAKIRRDYALREKIISNEINDYLHKNDIEIYFSPAQTIYPRGLENIKQVTSIMDLQFEYFPENFSPQYLSKRRSDGKYAVQSSDRLIAISEYTKKTLIEKYAAEPEKTKVIYFAPQEIKKEPVNIDLPEEFVFYPAALWPHKNHHILIEAMTILKNNYPSLHVICAGLNKGKKLKEDLERKAELVGLRDRISFPGLLFDGDLYLLYTKAKALVFPSSFEGFGIPLLEAMQYGLPVIAANNTSITEVVGDAGILVETGDAKALAEAIEKVLTDEPLCKELIRKGYERVKLFSWEKTARETLEVFNSLRD